MASPLGIIDHPDVARFAILRQDYVAVANGNHCAAMLLSIFEGYTNWLKKNHRSPWIDLSGQELSQAMTGLFRRGVTTNPDKMDIATRKSRVWRTSAD